MTTRVTLRGINRVRKPLADGRVIELHYLRGARGTPAFWRSDSAVTLGSPEYLAAYAAARLARGGETGRTFAHLIAAYRASPDFGAKAPRTRRDYAALLDLIGERFGPAPLAAFDDPRIRGVALRWRDRIASPKRRDYAWTVLRLVVAWGVDRGWLRAHHLQRGGRTYRVARAEIVWTEAELAAFERGAPAYVWRPVLHMAECGHRPGDLIRCARSHVFPTPHGRRIVLHTAKSGGRRVASVPVTERMARILDETPEGQDLLHLNATGTAWTEGALSRRVKWWARKLGLREELRLYDARGSAVTRLVAAGAGLDELARCFGWSSSTAAKMVETYAYLDPAMTDGTLARLRAIRPADSANRAANREGGDG